VSCAVGGLKVSRSAIQGLLFLFPVVIVLCSLIGALCFCARNKTWQRWPTVTALVLMMIVAPLAIFMAGGVYFPVLLVARDACAASEPLGRQVLAHSANKICTDILGGRVMNTSQVYALFEEASAAGTVEDTPALVGFGNDTDWSAPYCTMSLYGHEVSFSLLKAYDEFAGECPDIGA
jgi:hypothetical protein